MFQRYGEYRAEADRLLGEFIAIAEGARQPALAAGARQRRERLAANEFHVAAVSEFSNGKSTLLNALLGIDLLPTHRRPLTATVVRIRHGEEPEVRISFKDGRQAQATPGDGDLRKLLNHFTTTLTRASAEVDEVVVRYPLPLLAHGLVLLDTPGLESVYDPHDRLTRELLPTVDAVLVVVEAGKVGKLADLKLVRHLRFLRQDAVFFALNKVDQLRSAAEVEEAARELREMLRGVLDEPRIYPVSGLYALQARLLRAGLASPAALARDRRLAVPDGDGFRPVRDASDAGALEALSGIGALEADLEAYLLSADRVQDALKGAVLHVTARLVDGVLPDLRRLRAALERAEGREALLARVARCRAELGATRARMEGLLAPGGRLALARGEIWAQAVERRLARPAVERVVAALETAAGRGAGQAWPAVDYALKRLCADAARDLAAGWTRMLREVGRLGQAELDGVIARVEAHLGSAPAAAPAEEAAAPAAGSRDAPDADPGAREAGAAAIDAAAPAATPAPVRRLVSGALAGVALAAATVAWPAGLLAGAIGGLFRKGVPEGGPRARLLRAAEEAASRGREALADLHARYERAVRERLDQEFREVLAGLESNLARLEESLAERERSAERLAELGLLERRALALLEETKGLLARLERAAPAPGETVD